MSPNGTGEPEPTKEVWHHEYYHLQTIVSGFNTDCLTIKNWSVTIASAAIAYAYVEKAPELLIVSAASSVCFLITEAYWRANQSAFIVRIKEIESAEKKATIRSPTISTSWHEHWYKKGPEGFFADIPHIWESVKSMRTLLPHLLFMIVAVVLWFCSPPKATTDAHSCCGGSTRCSQADQTPATPASQSPQQTSK